MSSVPAPEASRRPDYFKNTVIVLLTLVSVFAALVTFLQNHASLSSSDLAQQSSFNAVSATGSFFRAGLDTARGSDVLQRYEDYVQRSVRADTKARALLMGANTDLAAQYTLDSARWREAAEEVATSDPLLSEYGQDLETYRETLSREAYVEEERHQSLNDVGTAFGQAKLMVTVEERMLRDRAAQLPPPNTNPRRPSRGGSFDL